jgi:hypothetical protein
MPSIEHETPIELIRYSPALIIDVVRQVTGQPVEGAATADLVPADVSAVVPAQFLADAVAVIKDRRGRPLLAVVIEPQGRDLTTKLYSWPAYICQARRAWQCDTILVVICWDQAQAAKCSQLIRTGHPGFDLAPLVSAPGQSLGQPGGFEPLSGPYWTLYQGYLHYIDMDTDDGQEQILQAARQVPVPDRASCITLMLAAASVAARRAMEAKMATVAYRSEFVESFIDQGRAQGQAQGLAEGQAQGLAEGQARGLAEAILEVLRVRGIEATAVQIARARACTDLDQLHAWTRAAVTASTADEVFSS